MIFFFLVIMESSQKKNHTYVPSITYRLDGTERRNKDIIQNEQLYVLLYTYIVLSCIFRINQRRAY